MQVALQHPRDLTLALFDGEPRYPLTLLRSRRVRAGTWDAHFHIIGESHAVILSCAGEPIFSEMLACVPVEDARCEYTHRFVDLATHTVQRGGYGGQVTFNADVLPPTLPDGLTVRFPAVYGEVPLTRVTWQYTQGCLQWQTLHTYPLDGDRICVYSASHFDFETYEHEGNT